MKKILTIIALFVFFVQLFPQEKLSDEKRLEWFENAKLGIFIHWGVYSVEALTSSWQLKNKQISWNDYMSHLKDFKAEKYNAEEWAELFKESGAKYVVLTSKHHDGFALWDTKLSMLNAKDSSGAKRDLLAPYAEALRKNGLKVGFYYSLIDWSHKDYKAGFSRPEKIMKEIYPQPEWQKNLTPHERFVKFLSGQLSELSREFQPDLFWFDGGWEHTSQWWRAEEIRDSLLSWNPKVIINDRLRDYGDYETAEQGFPTLRPKGMWELCMTINDHWGYAANDNNYKSDAQIVRSFVDVISNGGNLLLDIGPKADGTIDERQAHALRVLGAWIKRNKESVYGSKAGLPLGHFYGPTMLSKDDKTVYLALSGIPRDYILIKGLQTKIKDIRVLGSGEKLSWSRNGGAKWANIPGIVRIEIPDKLDELVTIIAVELEEPVKLYRGGGKTIEAN